MKFEITTMKLVKNIYGKNDIIISKIKVMNDEGKYIKFAQLNDALLKEIHISGSVTIKNPYKI